MVILKFPLLSPECRVMIPAFSQPVLELMRFVQNLMVHDKIKQFRLFFCKLFKNPAYLYRIHLEIIASEASCRVLAPDKVGHLNLAVEISVIHSSERFSQQRLYIVLWYRYVQV